MIWLFLFISVHPTIPLSYGGYMQSLFKTLDQFLTVNQAYWREEPFHLCQSAELPWKSNSPDLFEWLMGLNSASVLLLKNDPERLAAALTPYFPQLPEIEKQIQLPVSELSGLALPRGTDVGIPGRKLDQILAMGEVSLSLHQGEEWLEWCSGKGFLGRVLAQQSQQAVTSFEWQHALCESGQALADSQDLDMTFVQGDAFNDEADSVFNSNQHAVALHACGDLHVELLTKSVTHKLPAVTISPCCYHLIRGEYYQPLSSCAQSSLLRLNKQDLRVPLQETVTGGERVKRHRELEMSYRLGFNQLLRVELGYQEYLPVPSIKKSELGLGFESFCRWAADKKQLVLSEGTDFESYRVMGEELFWKMEKLSLVQQIFRRPLELWLALDKAMFLTENGYKSSIETFCDKAVTPRNILIHASKRQ